MNICKTIHDEITDLFDCSEFREYIRIEDRGCVIVSRTGKEDVAILAASELASIMETLHLLKSPANAKKLFAAMERADELEQVTMESQSLEELCRELDIEQ